MLLSCLGSWSSAAWLSPACVVMPACATELSSIIKTLVKTSTRFSMRGGGHMPIADAANINSTGVLISSSNLKTLQLSEDKETMSIGPGPRWGDVFEYMDGSNLTIVGGRLAPVGVPGLLLGGGISYYSYNLGLGASNGKIKAYEAVLANGTIVTVTADNEYSDLHWALAGGGNSFALITRFDLQTFYAPTPLVANAVYGDTNETRDAYIDALVNFANNGDQDTGAAVTPVARWGPNYTAPSYESTLFFNGTTAPTSGPFAEFYSGTTLKAINDSSTLQPTTLAQISKALRPAFAPGGAGYGFRQKFRVVPIKATTEAARIVHDNFFDSLAANGLANRAPGFFTGLAFNAVTPTMARQSAGMPQNVPQEPAFWVEQSVSWSDAANDAEIEEWLVSADAAMDEALQKINGTSQYLYLNDADAGQAVFESYGKESVDRLKEIREKYDPNKVYTELMPGGFKVDAVEDME
ncbi:hypothetical protein N8I77_004135 [Diaporthe amygdali]|uniref:FAD-binding PCMH-type domain-containing protein n=1 Tax=Phomopsis amygdali TaxID=1214568 RepID=A0AAD9SLF2_PHOAM|nr:hypothetical protein N8I77_004135 [Diaporthe amygdali]